MIRRILATPCLVLLLAAPAVAQTGQINGVITDNTGAVVPGATVKAVEVATGLSRDTVTGADGRYIFTSLRPTTYDISAELSGFRTSQRKGVLLQANQNLTVNFALEIGSLAETRHGVRRIAHRRRHLGDPQRSRRFEAHRRTAAERARRRDAEHAGAGDGADHGRSRVGQDDSRARCACRPTGPSRGRCRSGWTARATPIRITSRTSRSRFPMRCRNSAFRPATTAPRRATAPARWSTRSRAPAPTAFTAARSATCAIGEFTARNYFNPEKDFLKRKQYGGFAGGPILQNKMFFFAGWQGTTIANRGREPRAVRRRPTDERNGNFATCGAACNRALTDPLTGPAVPRQPDPGRALRSGLGERAEVPAAGDRRRADAGAASDRPGRQPGGVARSISSSAESNQIGVRYFFDHFTNDPTYTEGNLLTYRNPTLQSRVRAQNIVGSWTRTLSNTVAQRAARRLQPHARAPVSADQQRAQHAGTGRPAADLSEPAVDFGDQRQRLLQHRRQPRGLVRPQRASS